MQFYRISLWTIAFLLLVEISHGQNPRGRYFPSKPTVSPWLYLSTQETAGMPNYYAFVRPAQRQSQLNQSQQRQLQTQQGEIESLDGQFQLRDSKAPPTGTNSTFMNYSHYFPSNGGGARKASKSAAAQDNKR